MLLKYILHIEECTQWNNVLGKIKYILLKLLLKRWCTVMTWEYWQFFLLLLINQIVHRRQYIDWNRNPFKTIFVFMFMSLHVRLFSENLFRVFINHISCEALTKHFLYQKRYSFNSVIDNLYSVLILHDILFRISCIFCTVSALYRKDLKLEKQKEYVRNSFWQQNDVIHSETTLFNCEALRFYLIDKE